MKWEVFRPILVSIVFNSRILTMDGFNSIIPNISHWFKTEIVCLGKRRFLFCVRFIHVHNSVFLIYSFWPGDLLRDLHRWNRTSLKTFSAFRKTLAHLHWIPFAIYCVIESYQDPIAAPSSAKLIVIVIEQFAEKKMAIQATKFIVRCSRSRK